LQFSVGSNRPCSPDRSPDSRNRVARRSSENPKRQPGAQDVIERRIRARSSTALSSVDGEPDHGGLDALLCGDLERPFAEVAAHGVVSLGPRRMRLAPATEFLDQFALGRRGRP